MPHSIDPGSYRSPDRRQPAVTPPIEADRRAHDPYAAFRSGDFSLFTAGNLLSITGRLMLAVAVEWEIYARTHSATALGLVGLVIAVPVVTLSLPAGHLADRFAEVARFKAIEGKTWNHPVLVGDVLLVRNGEEMAAFRLRPAD